MNAISPFRFTVDDLPDLDKKTREGLQPLLDQLNVFVQQVNAMALALPETAIVSGTFSTDAAGSVYVPINPALATRAVSVTLGDLRPANGTEITSPYAFSWQYVGAGVRLLFVGLAVLTKYSFTVSVQ